MSKDTLEFNKPGQGSILLKPTGVPVFTAVDQTYKQTIKNQNETNSIQDAVDAQSLAGRTVRALSFVIGKKMQNQTEINLLESDKQDGEMERPFPIKVIYMKPSHSVSLRKNAASMGSQNDDQPENKENNSFKVNKQLKKDFPKVNAIGNQQKLAEQKHRPQSATTQSIKKNSIQHTKLGANSTIKPQISYIKKLVTSSEQRPKTAKLLNEKKKQPVIVEEEPAQAVVDIPFAKNRFQGQYNEITKDLLKKAKDALNEEKNLAIKQKQDQTLKKEKEKQITEEVRKKNSEMIQKQKEKGAEHVNFRKIEEDKKEQLRNSENNQERQQRREARDKRKQDTRKQMGLDMFKEENVEEYRKKVKAELEGHEQIKPQPKIKVKQRPQSEEIKSGSNNNKQITSDQPSYISKTGLLSNQINILKKQQVSKEIEKDIKIIDEEEEKRQNIDKKKLLKEQKIKWKQQQMELKKIEQEQDQKKFLGLKALEDKMRLQKEDYFKRKDQQERQKEEQERQREEQLRQQPNQNSQKQKKAEKQKKIEGQKHKEQLSELRDWIEEQMQKEDLQVGHNTSDNEEEDENDTQMIKQAQMFVKFNKKNKEDNSPNSDNEIMQAIQKKEVNQDILLKHALPGNHILNEKEESKLGSRQNRYGLFGDNGFNQVVEIQRNKFSEPVLSKTGNSNQKQPLQQSVQLSAEDKAKAKEFLQKKLREVTKGHKLGELVDGKQNSGPEGEDQMQQEKEPLSGNSIKRTIINIDQQQSKSLSVSASQNQRKKTSSNKDMQSPPGILNVEKELKRQQLELDEKKEVATVVIQQWARGFLARQTTHQLREKKRSLIEQEYGNFEDQVKFNSDYNLEKFLRDKQRLREANGTTKLGESSSIMEKIGGGDSFSTSLNKNTRPFTANATIPKLSNVKGMSQVKVQNYFREPTQKDSLSLIEIYARRHAHQLQSISGRKSDRKKTNSPRKVKGNQHHRKNYDGTANSEIEEDIYSEEFEDESRSSKNILQNDEIEEDIIDLVGSKDQSSSGGQINAKKIPFNYKPQLSSAISESIQEDLQGSYDRRGSPNKRSPDRESYIAEDSHLQHQFSGQSIALSSHKRNSIIEEDIEGASNYEEEGFESYSGSIQKPANTAQQKNQFKKQVSDFEIKMQGEELKRKEKMQELLGEMKRYEQASVSTVIVERMEKIMSETMAKKDKLLLGQRLHELELEKSHQQEINKIREEQIKLMSQLMLYSGSNQGGNSGMNEEERKLMMENIQKIIDKPITIVGQQQQQQDQLQQNIVSPSSAPRLNQHKPNNDMIDSYEEKEETDYIGQSKSIGQYSIKESIAEIINEDSAIEEDIPDEAPSQSAQESDDEIKESVYADGNKIGQKQLQQKPEAALQKMRMTLGSEETIRQQSKKTLQSQITPRNQENPSTTDNNGLFNNHSFEDYTLKKFKELIFDENAMKDYVQQAETDIDEKHKEQRNKLTNQLHKNIISPRTHDQKQKELEKWVSNERHDFQKKTKKTVQQIQEMGSYISKLDRNKQVMIAKIGSPRVGKRFHADNSTSSIDRQDDESDQFEESNESIRVRQAKYQIQNLSKGQNNDKEDKALSRKKRAAQKLIDEKERAIEDGIKAKLKNIEVEHIDNMLNMALNIDIQAEIDKRITGARRAMEESFNNQSEYDGAASQRRESEYDISQSGRSTIEDQRKKKKVNFASPERFSPSVHSHLESSDGVSSRNKFSANKYDDSLGQSIDESIKIEESYASKQGSSHQQNIKRSGSGDIIKDSGKDSIKEFIKDSIKESIRESVAEDNSSEYSEDFQSQSYQSSQNQANQFLESKNKLVQKAETLEDQSDIAYSMNFDDDSMANSQQLGGSITNKKPAEQQQQQQQKFESVREQPENDEDDNKSAVDQLDESAPPEEVEEEDIDQHAVDVTESLQGSSKYLSSYGQPAVNESQVDAQSEDKEIVQSTQSVDWLIAIEQPPAQSYRSVASKKQEEGSEPQYSENFENDTKRDNDMEDLDDLESFPDDIAESFDEYQLTVDNITDELLNLILTEYKDDPTLGVAKEQIDETTFYSKWPFTLDQQQSTKQYSMPAPVSKAPEIIVKKVSVEDQTKLKHEKDQAQLKEQQSDMLKYLDLIIDNVNKRDLITSLENPIEQDPLKVLAKIQAFENDDTMMGANGVNESNQQQFILSLDYFMKVENIYGKQNENKDPTKSENIHHKAIYDAFNEALDMERPYKYKGEPTPWSKQTRIATSAMTTNQANKILKKAKDRVVKWISTCAGTKYAPLPPPPPANSEYESSSNQPPVQPEEERRNALREERLGELLTKEIEENDHLWVDYENEDTQVKFDVADMVLEELAGEIAAFLNQKMMSRQMA